MRKLQIHQTLALSYKVMLQKNKLVIEIFITWIKKPLLTPKNLNCFEK